MFKELKLKLAARRVERRGTSRKTKKQSRHSKPTFWGRVWDVICWPFRMICRAIKWFWGWVRSIDLIGLVNLTLLVAIIVLFSMLVIDVVRCTKRPNVIVAQPVPVETVRPPTRIVKPRPTLPVQDNVVVNVVPTKRDVVAEKQTARINNKMFGDIIIDSRGAGKMLNTNTQVQGNLYLQNMRKFVLPCGVKIDGNLFLRDVNLLQFCGEFTVTGNIYVNPRSSFGPIPYNARVGGYVIL